MGNSLQFTNSTSSRHMSIDDVEYIILYDRREDHTKVASMVWKVKDDGFRATKGDISKCEKPGRRANRVQLELHEVIEVAKGQLRTAMPCREHEF